MSSEFQTAVKKGVSREHREAAIDRMIETGERQDLAVLVQMSGLTGALRRRALDGLVRCRATEKLEAIATDPSVPDSLSRRAGETV